MRTVLFLTLAATGCVLLTSCKSGYNRPYRKPPEAPASTAAPACTTSPATTNLSASAASAYTYLRRLSCNDPELETGADGVIAGHSIYYGSDSRLRELGSYDNVLATARDNGGVPGLLEFTYETGYGVDLVEVNTGVVNFVQNNPGGMVMITWRPGNPDDSDNGPGYVSDTNLDLAELVDSNSNFRSQLDQVGQALVLLRNSDIPVLFNPMPAPNTDDYWWGTQNSYTGSGTNTTASTYIELYLEARNYLITNYQLNNVLWLYSPAESPTSGSTASKRGAPVRWTYPGDAYVDIVSPEVRNDYLLFDDYEDITEWDKPMGFSAFGPADITRSEFSSAAPFEFDTFSEALKQDYNAAAFFVSPYNTYFDANPDDDVEPEIGSTSYFGFEGLPDSLDSAGIFLASDLAGR